MPFFNPEKQHVGSLRFPFKKVDSLICYVNLVILLHGTSGFFSLQGHMLHLFEK
jgi:hypothetical protein